MTVSSAVNRNDYTGNGAVDTYSYTFKIFEQGDLLVTVADDDGVETTLVIATDYTVTGVGSSAGGTIVLVDADQAWLDGDGDLLTGYNLTIRRSLDVLQETDFPGQGSFYPETHEDALDRLTMIAQQHADELGRSPVLPETEDGADYDMALPTEANRASKVLGFDADGNVTAVANVPTSGVSATAYMETLLDDANATTARTTLGFTGSGGVVATGDLANLAVSTAKIAADAVTVAKLASETCAQIFQARLTLATATAVTTTDQTAKTTIYLTPFGGDKIALYNSSKWSLSTLTEISIAVPATTNQMYDIYVYSNAGTLTLELSAWTNDTTRATALVLQNGVLVKTGSTDRRYAGSFRTTGSSGQTEDSLTKRYLWNYYNRVRRSMRVVEATNTWTYTTATFQQANASTANQLDMVVGVSEDEVVVDVMANGQNTNGSVTGSVGVGINSASTNSALTMQAWYTGASTVNINMPANAHYAGYLAVGRNYITWLEQSTAAGTTTWVGDNGGTVIQSGIYGSLLG